MLFRHPEVNEILEGILQGLMQWLYSLCLELVEYVSNSLLGVFRMDLDYFISIVPIFEDMFQIICITGWALLLGNLLFQALKSMVSGIGIEGEDPKLLFTRTFLFSFLLLCSRQICDIGLGMTKTVIELLQIPEAVTITTPEANGFGTGAAWLLAIIIGIIIIWHVFKLFVELGERYALLSFLVLFSPLAFSMGGSENTKEIFRGWVRMFASMCVMMISHVVFLKATISALGYILQGLDAVPWAILIVGITRVAKKFDEIVSRIGLNPAITGGGLGRTFPGALTYAVVRGMGSRVGASFGKTPPSGGQQASPSSDSQAKWWQSKTQHPQDAQKAQAAANEQGNHGQTVSPDSAQAQSKQSGQPVSTRRATGNRGTRPSYVSTSNPQAAQTTQAQNPTPAGGIPRNIAGQAVRQNENASHHSRMSQAGTRSATSQRSASTSTSSQSNQMQAGKNSQQSNVFSAAQDGKIPLQNNGQAMAGHAARVSRNPFSAQSQGTASGTQKAAQTRESRNAAVATQSASSTKTISQREGRNPFASPPPAQPNTGPLSQARDGGNASVAQSPSAATSPPARDSRNAPFASSTRGAASLERVSRNKASPPQNTPSSSSSSVRDGRNDAPAPRNQPPTSASASQGQQEQGRFSQVPKQTPQNPSNHPQAQQTLNRSTAHIPEIPKTGSRKTRKSKRRKK